MNAKSAEVHAKAIAENREEFYPELGATLGYSPLKCGEIAGKMYDELGPILDDYDVFVCPANNLPAVMADVDLLNDPVVINRKEVTGRDMGWTMAYPFNMLGRLPVISVPSGFASNKVPTGIQIISRSYSDNLVFQAAFNYENIDPWLHNAEKWPKI